MIKISTGETHAIIAAQGAEPLAWRVGERPLLWTADADVWPETAPLLFPVVGWTRRGKMCIGGEVFPLGLHGFARHKLFRVTARGEDRVCLELASDEDTLRLYPFQFVFAVEHRVTDAALATTLNVTNTGTTPMPYACGLHPGFRWPFADGEADGYRLCFAQTENPVIPCITPGGLIAQAMRRLPMEENVLSLDATLFDNDALCFLNAKSRHLSFQAPDGAAIDIKTENFSHIGVWCRPGHGYLCIEQWTGFSDPDGFTGDIFDKPSMHILPPGETARHSARYRYKPAP